MAVKHSFLAMSHLHEKHGATGCVNGGDALAGVKMQGKIFEEKILNVLYQYSNIKF